MLLEQGKSSQALAYLDKALEIDPDHGQALLNSAILLQEIGRPDLRQIARERLLKLLTMDGMSQFIIHFIPFRSSFWLEAASSDSKMLELIECICPRFQSQNF